MEIERACAAPVRWKRRQGRSITSKVEADQHQTHERPCNPLRREARSIRRSKSIRQQNL